MGIGTGGTEQAVNSQAYNFPGVGAGTWVGLEGDFNLNLWGTFTASIALERSYDGGTTALPVCTDVYGTAATFTTPVSITGFEPEAGVLYRLRCTAWTSGTALGRLSQ